LRGRPRPTAAARTGDRLKLHRRRLRLDGREHTVITLRPGTDARFSTNRHHETWHVLSDWGGARLLGRLLWGLSYQRVPGTVVLIDRAFLAPEPFEAVASDPIALVPAQLTPWSDRAARDLRRRLPWRASPDGTVRWHTPGLDGAVAAARAYSALPLGERDRPWTPPGRRPRRGVDRIGGMITFTGLPEALRETAVDVHRLGDRAQRGMDYTEVDWPRGEVQVFHNYRRRVSAARVARRELGPAAGAEPMWQRGTEVRRRNPPERQVDPEARDA
jgi:hypothetical protein